MKITGYVCDHCQVEKHGDLPENWIELGTQVADKSGLLIIIGNKEGKPSQLNSKRAVHLCSKKCLSDFIDEIQFPTI